MKDRSQLFRQTPSIKFYIESVLDQQQETYGLASKHEKLDKRFENDLKASEKLRESSTWVKTKQKSSSRKESRIVK